MPKPTPNSNPNPGESSGATSRAGRGAAVESVPCCVCCSFTAAEKLRIVREADGCLARGERGGVEALLRREGIYSSLLCNWRTQISAAAQAGFAARKPGRVSKLDEKDLQLAENLRQISRLQRRLEIAEGIIELQKKVSAMRSEERRVGKEC